MYYAYIREYCNHQRKLDQLSDAKKFFLSFFLNKKKSRKLIKVAEKKEWMECFYQKSCLIMRECSKVPTSKDLILEKLVSFMNNPFEKCNLQFLKYLFSNGNFLNQKSGHISFWHLVFGFNKNSSNEKRVWASKFRNIHELLMGMHIKKDSFPSLFS